MKPSTQKLILQRRQAKVFRENQQGKLIPDEKLFHDGIRDKLAGLAEGNQFHNFTRCGEERIFRTCRSCGALEEFAYRCSLKWCPNCQWRIAEARRLKIETWAKHITQPKHVVLTCKNFPILTRKRIRAFQINLARLRRHDLWANVRGGCASIEITNEGSGWHLHAHLLLDCRFIPADLLSFTWGGLVGQNFAIVKVKDCREKSYAHEIFKYLAKGSEIASWPAEQILEFITAIRGLRFFFQFGSLYKAGKEIRAEIARQKKPAGPCECGATDYIFETEQQTIINEVRQLARQKRSK